MDFPFRTEIKINESGKDFNYSTPAFFIGSCFSDNIGRKLEKSKFTVMLNPFGVLYNPVSICSALNTIIKKTQITHNDLILHNNLYHSFLFHGSFSCTSPEKLIMKCNEVIEEANNFLKKSSFIFITFGSSFVYEYKETGEIVSNCHKIPDSAFKRYRLTVEQTVSKCNELISDLKYFNPELQIIFTVSPVRHFKDGAHENQLSKSVLLLAIDEIIKDNSNKEISYFPAYEIMNDELRDYRFYTEDMIHISEIGVNYIYAQFRKCFFKTNTLECMKEINEIVRASEHRILNPDPVSLSMFRDTMIAKILKFGSAYPFINFNKELEHFNNLSYIE
ncbi:MAG: GSCFA domain-containing protein [Prolixibacteraceae bacterium]|nr:GSCFA domain-containing protein [Prolixibacteraceae bacterium]